MQRYFQKLCSCCGSWLFQKLFLLGVCFLYLIAKQKDNITYSVDMLRLKTNISYLVFVSSVEPFLKRYMPTIGFSLSDNVFPIVKQFYIGYKYAGFRYNYVLNISEIGSIYIGFMNNTEKIDFNQPNNCYNFTLEFNPNKVKDNFVLDFLFSLSSSWFLKSFDMACDLPINILNILFDKNRKRDYKIFSSGFDNKTIYIGKRSSGHSVKIYNKKIESKLDIFNDLTRIEINKAIDDFPINNIHQFIFSVAWFPSLYLLDYQYSYFDTIDKTLFACLFAVQNGLSIDMLSRSYKEKIKGLLKLGNAITFDNNVATQVLKDIIYFYFY
jgi:hypothetical protein